MNVKAIILSVLVLAVMPLVSCSKAETVKPSEPATTTKDYNEMIMDYFEDNSAPPAPKKKYETQVDSTNTFEYVDAEGYMDIYGRTYGDEGIVITKYLGDDTTVTIPAEIDGKKVAGNFSDAFSEMYENEDGYRIEKFFFKEVYFDEEYPEVDCVTFAYSDVLEYIKLPRSQKRLQPFAFNRCTNLKCVELTSTLESIDEYAFERCESLTEFEFGDGLKSIGLAAFDSCYSLKSIDLPDSLESIGRSAFSKCRSLKEVNIPEKVTVIPYGAFSGCDSLETVRLSDGVTEIDENAFIRCSRLKDIYIPDSVTTISENAFKIRNSRYNTNVTIHCSQDSYAMQYAKKYRIDYVVE